MSQVTGLDEPSETTSDSDTTGVAIEFSFPLGRYHATPAGTTANEAGVEWPPSPWRILRTFVSTWYLRCPDVHEDDVLTVLQALAGPCEYSVPRRGVGHTRHYLPGDEVINPVGSLKTFKTIDAFASLQLDASIVVHWPHANLDDASRELLGKLCSQITYLGRSESLCDCRLIPQGEAVPTATSRIVSDGDPESQQPGWELVRLLTAEQPVDLATLTVDWSELRSNSKKRAVMPPNTSYVTYSVESLEPVRYVRPAIVQPMPKVTAVRYEILPNSPKRAAPTPKLGEFLAYTHILRSAAQSRFGAIAGSAAPSAALSGRSGTGTLQGHGHAHYLAIPTKTESLEARKVRSFVVWIPDGIGVQELAALTSINGLWSPYDLPGFRRCNLMVTAVGSIEEVAPELVAPQGTQRFESATPVVPGRGTKGRHSWQEQIQRELAGAIQDRGLPQGRIEVHESIRGVTTRRPKFGRNSNHWAYPYPHRVSIEFDTPQVGPLTLGAMSHFGMGLFFPVP